MIKIKRLHSFEDIGKEAWSQVLKVSSENYFFQTYEFASTWWKYFGENQKNKELFLLVVEDGGSPIAIAPLMLKKIPYLNQTIVQFIGGDICDYMGLIIDGKNYEKYFSKILEHLSGLRFLEIDLKFIPHQSKILQNADSIDGKNNILRRISQVDACPYIDLGGDWQKIINGVRKKLIGEIRRNEQKIREKGDLLFKIYNQEIEPEKLLGNYFDLHVKKWKGYSGKYSQFQYGHWRGFITALSRSIRDKGWLDISYLELNGNMIACHFGFIYNRRFYYYMPTFDPDMAPYSPAKILIMKMLKRAYNNGLKEFDFLRGKEPYKLAWTKISRPLYSIRFYNSNLSLHYSGFIYRGLNDGYAKSVKPVLKKIKPLMKIWYASRGEKNEK